MKRTMRTLLRMGSRVSQQLWECRLKRLCTGPDFSHLADRAYWDKKYRETSHLSRQQPTPFDWLLDFGNIEEDLLALLAARASKQPQDPIALLDLGCGTSKLVSKLLQAHPQPMLAFCVDYSMEALVRQQELANIHDRHKIFYLQADASKLGLLPQTIDFIIDKGTTDSVLKDKIMGVANAKKILQECLHVMRPGGTLIQITDEDPDLRLSLLENAGKELGHKTLQATFRTLEVEHLGFEYFMYIVNQQSSSGGF